MKHFPSSKIAAILAIASLAMIYGCENESSSSSETLTCPSDAPLCGGVCCPYECNNNECAFPGGSTTPAPKTEDDCTKNGQTFCSGKCVSTQSDPMHCGDCTTICAGEEVCQDGKCVFGCGNGLTLVGNGLCVDTNSDSEHCGADNIACGDSMYCNNGQCQCMDKHYDCDGNADNGCESAIKCEYLCEEGKKTCGLNFCCAENESCCGSSCCAEGTTCCGGTTCIDLQSDPHHCGSCKEECKASEKCDAGKCVDNSKACDTEGQMACWGACIDVMSDAKNCGSCDHICDEGISCIDGKCQIVCSDALQLCDDECVDFNTSPKHCGNCETQCANTQTCVEGTCSDNTEVSCENEEINKDLCWGACVDMQSDTNHCGKCGQTCSKDQICVSGACIDQPEPGECSAGQKMCFGECKDILTDINNCGDCLHQCGENHTCIAGQCEPICTESQIKCDGACFDPKSSSKHCGACNNACGAGMECREVEGGTGACQCDAGHFDCDGDPANGCESTTECACTKGQKQACWRGTPETRGKGACKDGEQTCDASGKFWGPCEGGVYPSATTCNDAGIYYGDDRNCNGIPDEQEECKSKCDLMMAADSYIGCEYWPVFLQNLSGHHETNGTYYDLTLVVSNPNDVEATIYVFDKTAYQSSTANSLKPYLTFKVPASSVVYQTIVGTQGLQKNTQGQYNAAIGSTTRTIYEYMLKNTMRAPFAFKMRSTVPVSVYQFNPYGKPEGFTMDASLLLPVNTLGKDYIHMTYYTSNYADHAGYISVVATQPGTTTVSITPKLKTSSGTDKTNNTTIESIAPNTTKTFTLNQFDVLSLQQNTAGESTGAEIKSDKLIGAFGGAGCISIAGACDHIEEQLFPLQAWGKEYDAIRTSPVGSEYNYYYILSQADNTVVTIKGNSTNTNTDTISLSAYTGGSASQNSFTIINTANKFTGSVTLNKGQYTKIQTIKNFEVSANNPILVGQFMDHIGGPGDPAFILNVPREQYRPDYSFAIPSGFTSDYVTLIAPKGSKIEYKGSGTIISGSQKQIQSFTLLENLPSGMFSGWKDFGYQGYVYGYLDLDGGTHFLKGDKAFGAIGYGTYSYTSYGYPIGLDLKRINNTN